jgi:diguanylate cyclase (GGDEF)-like protein
MSRDPRLDGLWPLLERTSDGILLISANPWRVEYANAAAAKCLGASGKELEGRLLQQLVDAKSYDVVISRLESALHNKSCEEVMQLTLVSASGATRNADAQFCGVTADDRVFVGIILINSPTEETVSRIDPLTGLLDRGFLVTRLAELLRERARVGEPFAILFVDMNNFKEVNDRHGHLVGDQLLGEASQRFANCLRSGDRIVRYGGDEFVVLIEQLATPADVESIVERINAAMEKPLSTPDGDVTLSVSVGVAIGPAAYESPDELLAAADRAMYAAKRGSE